jgi:hypothetical protein
MQIVEPPTCSPPEQVGSARAGNSESLPCVSGRSQVRRRFPYPRRWSAQMLMLRERRSAYRTIESWAIGVLLKTGAINECEEHGYMQCRGDPDARTRAYDTARAAPFPGASVEEAVVALHDVLGSIGDTCPDCR